MKPTFQIRWAEDPLSPEQLLYLGPDDYDLVADQAAPCWDESAYFAWLVRLRTGAWVRITARGELEDILEPLPSLIQVSAWELLEPEAALGAALGMGAQDLPADLQAVREERSFLRIAIGTERPATPPDLERRVVKALETAKVPLPAKKLANNIGYNDNPWFRGCLSDLKKRGRIAHRKGSGYTLPRAA